MHTFISAIKEKNKSEVDCTMTRAKKFSLASMMPILFLTAKNPKYFKLSS